MTSGPWSFGINRRDLEAGVVDLCEIVTTQAIDPTFTRDKISIVDQGAGRPFKPRPCITIKISSPIGSQRAGANERNWPSKERWLLVFTDSSDATYTATVETVDYDVVAVGLSITALRDAMLTEMAVVHPNWTTTSVGTDSIQLDSTVDGLQLFVSTSPATFTATRTVLNYFQRNFTPALLQCNIQCWGLLSIEDPSAVQGGPSIAENIRAAFLTTLLSMPLDRCGFSVITARVLDGGDIENDQTNSDSTAQIVFRAMTRFDIQVASGNEINTNPTLS